MGLGALAAYNATGTQHTAAVCKVVHEDDGDVQSAFWNRNDTTRFLLFGSSIQEIPTSGGQAVAFGGNQIFTVNNDLDCLGNIYAQIELSNTLGLAYSTDATTTDLGAIATLREWGLVRFISRIEFMVGTQIWQTMESNDLINVLNTELSESAYLNLASQVNGDYTLAGPKHIIDANRGVYNETLLASVPLPLLTKTLAPALSRFTDHTEDGYLMAAAPHQQVKIRLSYTSNSADVFSNFTQKQHMLGWAGARVTAAAPTDPVAAASDFRWNVRLYAKQQIMCNAERQQLKQMPMGLPKRIKMTQHASAQVTLHEGTTASAIDLDHFSLYASYLVVSISGLRDKLVGFDSRGHPINTEAPDLTATAPSDITADQARAISEYHLLAHGTQQSTAYGGIAARGSILDAELLLNSTSVSGILPGQFLTSSAAESMGLFSNQYNTGRRNAHPDSGFFVFPLASHAYDASAVPLNRFDNIRLRLRPSTDGLASDKVCNVIVTCVGETTALYKGGAASLAMY